MPERSWGQYSEADQLPQSRETYGTSVKPIQYSTTDLNIDGNSIDSIIANQQRISRWQNILNEAQQSKVTLFVRGLSMAVGGPAGWVLGGVAGLVGGYYAGVIGLPEAMKFIESSADQIQANADFNGSIAPLSDLAYTYIPDVFFTKAQELRTAIETSVLNYVAGGAGGLAGGNWASRKGAEFGANISGTLGQKIGSTLALPWVAARASVVDHFRSVRRITPPTQFFET